MKVLFTIFIFITFIISIKANDQYEKAMKKNLEQIGASNTAGDFIKTANNFERIARAEKDKWLPYYYSSFLYVLAGFQDSSNTQKDIYLDKAAEFINIADSLEPNNSEIYTVKGMIAQGRLQVDPMNRWQKYGTESTNNFNKAIELDPTNPRPEYLIGVGTYYTPAQFGGGALNAKPILESSMKKYEAFEPTDDLMPNWGKEMVENLLKQINGEQ